MNFERWLKEGGTWELPAGTHRVKAFRWPDVCGSSIVGQGRDATRLIVGGDDYGILVSPTGALRSMSLAALSLESDSGQLTDLVRIEHRVSHIAIHDIHFRLAKQSLLRVTTNEPGEMADITGCVFTDLLPPNDRAAGGAILGTVPRTRIRRCHFAHAGTGWMHSIYPTHATRLGIDHCTFSGPNCRIHLYGGEQPNTDVQIGHCVSVGVEPHYFAACPSAIISDCAWINSSVRVGSDGVGIFRCHWTHERDVNLLTLHGRDAHVDRCVLEYADWAVGSDRFAIWDTGEYNTITGCTIRDARHAWMALGQGARIRECHVRTRAGDDAEVIWPRADRCEILGNRIITDSSRAIWNEAPDPSTTRVEGNTVESLA